METDEKRGMTAEEFGLLKEAVRWWRNRGGTFFQWGPKSFGRLSEWKRWTIDAEGRNKQVNISWEYASSPQRLLAAKDYVHGDFAELPVSTVTEAVAVLAALGYLPPRFSSAYRAGWHASAVWHDGVPNPNPVEFRRLFHDPENISFPVGDDA